MKRILFPADDEEDFVPGLETVETAKEIPTPCPEFNFDDSDLLRQITRAIQVRGELKLRYLGKNKCCKAFLTYEVPR